MRGLRAWNLLRMLRVCLAGILRDPEVDCVQEVDGHHLDGEAGAPEDGARLLARLTAEEPEEINARDPVRWLLPRCS